MSTLVKIGLCELAVGTLFGWLVTVTREKREWLPRLGISSPRRILQCHIDYLLMGLILIAIGTVLPNLATVWQVLLVAGTIVNPALFALLAFGEQRSDTAAYRATAFASFTVMSGSVVAAALTAL